VRGVDCLRLYILPLLDSTFDSIQAARVRGSTFQRELRHPQFYPPMFGLLSLCCPWSIGDHGLFSSISSPTSRQFDWIVCLDSRARRFSNSSSYAAQTISVLNVIRFFGVQCAHCGDIWSIRSLVDCCFFACPLYLTYICLFLSFRTLLPLLCCCFRCEFQILVCSVVSLHYSLCCEPVPSPFVCSLSLQSVVCLCPVPCFLALSFGLRYVLVLVRLTGYPFVATGLSDCGSP